MTRYELLRKGDVMSEASDAVNRNVQRVMDDDGPPRLRYDMELCVHAKDTKKGYTLLGGLGVFGVGRMWFKHRPDMESYPGWSEAPEVEYKPKEKK